MPEACPYARGYYDRRKEALAALLDGGGQLDRPAIEAAARQFTVCPFELGLDLSDWADLVIGDYNYLFDPTVHLRRFFELAGDWIFLIDEAHNLPDRARRCTRPALPRAASPRPSGLCCGGQKRLERPPAPGRTGNCLSCAGLWKRWRPAGARRPAPGMRRRRSLPRRSSWAFLTSRPPQKRPPPSPALPEPLYAQDGTVFFRELPPAVVRPLYSLLPPLQDWLEHNPDDPAHEQLLDLYFSLHDLLRTADRYDEHSVTQLTARGSELTIRLLCLDPSAFVDESLACGRTSVLFSATLIPPAYYKKVLGCGGARAVALESPFPPGNLGLYCLPGISTRYRHREAVSAPSRTRWLLWPKARWAITCLLPQLRLPAAGLGRFYRPLSRHPHHRPGERAGRGRAGGLSARFAPDPAETLLGFGVLGGVFGRGSIWWAAG